MAMAVLFVYLIIVLFLWGLNSRITVSGLEGNCTQGTLYTLYVLLEFIKVTSSITRLGICFLLSPFTIGTGNMGE